MTGGSGVGDDTMQQAVVDALNGVIGWMPDWPPSSAHADHIYEGGCAVCRTKEPASLPAIAEALSAAGLLAVPAAPAATGSAVTISVEQTDVIEGWVCDAGGGQIGILVDRDTETYPPLGAHVTVAVDRLAAAEETT